MYFIQYILSKIGNKLLKMDIRLIVPIEWTFEIIFIDVRVVENTVEPAYSVPG